jgi:hypothetical protein
MMRVTPRRTASGLGQFQRGAHSASKSNLPLSSSRLHQSVSSLGVGLNGSDSFHPSSKTNLGTTKKKDEPEEVPVWQKRKDENALQKAEFEKSIGNLDLSCTF